MEILNNFPNKRENMHSFKNNIKKMGIKSIQINKRKRNHKPNIKSHSTPQSNAWLNKFNISESMPMPIPGHAPITRNTDDIKINGILNIYSRVYIIYIVCVVYKSRV